ncbi:MAG: hypothetical protein WD649_05650 [Thermoleophilaceae bacterium]
MGRGVLALGMLCAALTIAGCGDDDDKGDSSKPVSQQRESFLFVQDARTASVDTRKGTLTLRGASPSVQYFSDRPERIAGLTSVDSFRKSWKRLFGDDPPNAAIHHVASPSGSRAQVAELLGPPRYEGGRTLTYRIKLVEAPRDTPSPVPFAGVSLFIDAGSEDSQDLDPKRVGHCSPIDPRCATAETTAGRCSPIDPRCDTTEAKAGCSPIDPRCKNVAAPCPSVTNPGPCRGAAARSGCTITDPRCPKAVAPGCSPWDPRCKAADAQEPCRNPYDCQVRGQARCVYSPTTPDCPTLEDRPGCNHYDTHDCPARPEANKEQ